MGSVVSIDPALRRMLDHLPIGDPDAAPERMAEVWLAFCEGRHLVPIGRFTHVDFGQWHGPDMHWSEIVIHVSVPGVGEGTGKFDSMVGPPIITRRAKITGNIKVNAHG